MWSSVLGLALLGALHPVRLGLTLLIISRPRPVLNLLAYWLGGLTLSVPVLLVPLVVVHSTPMFKSVTHESGTAAASSTVRHIQLGIGVFALSIAALITVRYLSRQRTRLVAPGNNPSSMAADSDAPIAIRRLLGRAQDAWENGSLWVAWVIGVVSVSVDGVLFVAAIIVASAAAIGTQAAAAVAYLVLLYVVVEVILVAYLATPAKTQAVLRRLHDWASAHRHHVLIAIFAVVGVSQVAQGVGIV
ncbi:GAP family protein [Mycobacterium branderi]|uniref:GAP family protein n=1 Tax=Mycobacterium branderi TaxID=43348 RepID=A0A7I7W7I8_9MYCO|nr:GAP family protein [Mycobacterium branderi]MCV7236445.1 GAP family protein [Mycobacterium branderi]ORA31809.1 hypothetical protein BST20_26230 [Mycobacterium branderi]BBZ13080.1 hypothetical protein MBRA_32750 [Mycobacterium branderi]